MRLGDLCMHKSKSVRTQTNIRCQATSREYSFPSSALTSATHAIPTHVPIQTPLHKDISAPSQSTSVSPAVSIPSNTFVARREKAEVIRWADKDFLSVRSWVTIVRFVVSFRKADVGCWLLLRMAFRWWRLGWILFRGTAYEYLATSMKVCLICWCTLFLASMYCMCLAPKKGICSTMNTPDPSHSAWKALRIWVYVLPVQPFRPNALL